MAQALESCGPLQELDDEHAIFESLVLIFQQVLLLSSEEQTSIASNSDDGICDRIVRLLLEAGLFCDSKLPARYWSFHDLLYNSYWSFHDLLYNSYWSFHDPLYNSDMNHSPLTLAIHVRNVYAIKLLVGNGYDVDEVHHGDDIHNCKESRGTPLTYAIWLGFIEIVTVLLAAGADVTKMGAQGQTAAVFAGICVSLPVFTKYVGFVKDTGSDRCEDGTASRRQIFAMVCHNLETRHGIQYQKFVDVVKTYSPKASRLRSAGIQTAHPDFAKYRLMGCR